MTYVEFAREMNSFRLNEIKEATLAKEMNLVWINLHKMYSRFDGNERTMADRVIGEWLQSEDPTVRGDAQYLISKCHIKAADKGLLELACRLVEIVNPTIIVRHELEHVQRILARIRDHQGASA